MRRLSWGVRYRTVRNIDFYSLRAAGLQLAEMRLADNVPAARAGHSPMFRGVPPTLVTLSNSAFRQQADQLHNALQIIRAVVFDFDSALFLTVMQNHACAQIFL
jgi:hypothetical protein